MSALRTIEQRSISPSFAILLTLIYVQPSLLILKSSLSWEGISLLTAIGIATGERSLSQIELKHFLRCMRPVLICASIPLLWMTIQIMPTPFFANPIWESARTAAAIPLFPLITIDIGTTVMTIGRYIMFCEIVVLTAMLGGDRRNAELILINLMAATALFSLLQLSQTLPFLYQFSKSSQVEALNCMALSLLLACATVFWIIERHESRREGKPSAIKLLAFGAAACFGVAALSFFAAFLSHDLNPTYAFSISIILFLSLMFLRRTNLDLWLKSLIAAIIGLIALAAFAQSIPSVQILLGTNANGDNSDPINRMLAEAPFFGVGAGAIPGFYAILGGRAAGDLAYSQLIAIEILLIELGPVMAAMIFLAVLTGFLYLIRCTLLRGRDSFFPALGASAFLGMVLIALSNAQLFGESFSTLAAALYGLAFIQSRGRSII